MRGTQDSKQKFTTIHRREASIKQEGIFGAEEEEEITLEHYAMLEDAFRMHDTKGNGFLTKDDLRRWILDPVSPEAFSVAYVRWVTTPPSSSCGSSWPGSSSISQFPNIRFCPEDPSLQNSKRSIDIQATCTYLLYLPIHLTCRINGIGQFCNFCYVSFLVVDWLWRSGWTWIIVAAWTSQSFSGVLRVKLTCICCKVNVFSVWWMVWWLAGTLIQT